MNRRRRDPEPLGIVMIHGAAVVMEGRALIFLGPSGAGKSTISQILEPFAPVIGDDRLYLIPQESKWRVANATTLRALMGALTEEESHSLASVPLGTVFRLIQDSNTHVEPVEARQICRYLCNAVYEFYWSRTFDIQTQKTIFSKIADISRKTLGFDLYFDRSMKTVDEIRNTIAHTSNF